MVSIGLLKYTELSDDLYYYLCIVLIQLTEISEEADVTLSKDIHDQIKEYALGRKLVVIFLGDWYDLVDYLQYNFKPTGTLHQQITGEETKGKSTFKTVVYVL